MGPNNATDNTYLGKHVRVLPTLISRESGNVQTVGYAAPRHPRIMQDGGGGTPPTRTMMAPLNRQLEYYGHPATMTALYLRRM